MALFSESLRELGRHKALTLALVLPALPYLALCCLMPAQYRFVVVDAFQQGGPLLWALVAMIAYLGLLLVMLAGAGALTRLFAGLATLSFGAAILSFVFATGPTLASVLIIVLATAIIAGLILALSRKAVPAALARPRWLWISLAAGLVLFLGAGAASLAEPLVFPRALGSLAILALALGIFALWIAAMALRPKFAIASILLAGVSLLLFDSNDHRIPVTEAKASATPLDESFTIWLSSRRDLDAYRTRKMAYPVIFVSSEGGGIYAAAHAYGTLSTIARHCPTFSQHIFAAVGVSGGAIGNALFAASVDPAQKPYQPCSPRGAAIAPEPITTDHLSPVLARLLFVETVDGLLPGRWMARDRAQILTDSFLSVAQDKNYARAAITDSFDPTGARPALIAVTTDRDSGNRFVIAPFRPVRPTAEEWWPAPWSADAGDDEARQVSLINAAGLSARFPWVTPTGRLRVTNSDERILADGGYFDNSGANTVMDLIDALKLGQNWAQFWDAVDRKREPAERPALAACDKVRIKIVRNFYSGDNDAGTGVRWDACEIPIYPVYFALASSEPPPEGDHTVAEKAPALRQSFLGDPLAVLLETRRSRGNVALDAADLQYCGLGVGSSGSECTVVPGNSVGMFRNQVHPEAWGLPLGWFMARDRFDTILRRTASANYFGFRQHRRPADTETELMLYHLDPALYDGGANPAIGDLMSNFGP